MTFVPLKLSSLPEAEVAGNRCKSSSSLSTLRTSTSSAEPVVCHRWPKLGQIPYVNMAYIQMAIPALSKIPLLKREILQQKSEMQCLTNDMIRA